MHYTKLEILKEIDNFLNQFHLPKLKETKKTNVNRNKHLGKLNSLQIHHQYEPTSMRFRVESYQTSREDLTRIQCIQQYRNKRNISQFIFRNHDYSHIQPGTTD